MCSKNQVHTNINTSISLRELQLISLRVPCSVPNVYVYVPSQRSTCVRLADENETLHGIIIARLIGMFNIFFIVYVFPKRSTITHISIWLMCFNCVYGFTWARAHEWKRRQVYTKTIERCFSCLYRMYVHSPDNCKTTLPPPPPLPRRLQCLVLFHAKTSTENKFHEKSP